MREISLTAEPTLGEIPLRNATAFFSQDGFEVARVIDGAVEAGVENCDARLGQSRPRAQRGRLRDDSRRRFRGRNAVDV